MVMSGPPRCSRLAKIIAAADGLSTSTLVGAVEQRPRVVRVMLPGVWHGDDAGGLAMTFGRGEADGLVRG
jgi:hypothetical protein